MRSRCFCYVDCSGCSDTVPSSHRAIPKTPKAEVYLGSLRGSVGLSFGYNASSAEKRRAITTGSRPLNLNRSFLETEKSRCLRDLEFTNAADGGLWLRRSQGTYTRASHHLPESMAAGCHLILCLWAFDAERQGHGVALPECFISELGPPITCRHHSRKCQPA